jgi:hypothetical protein
MVAGDTGDGVGGVVFGAAVVFVLAERQVSGVY